MYVYAEQKQRIFTEDGQRNFLRLRDNVKRFLKFAGAFRAHEGWEGIPGDDWFKIACIDRLVELGEIRELTPPDTSTRYKIYTYA